ncbi:hypothetical protein ABPG72_009343 [Tetrahymena utriculariae]
MASEFEDLFQKRDQRQSTLLIKSQIDGQKDLQLTDTHVDRSRQRHLFEQQINQLHQSHHGDSDVQENSFQDRTSRTLLELKPQSSHEVTFHASFIYENKQVPNINNEKNDEIRCNNVEFKDGGESQIYGNQQTQQQIDVISEFDQKCIKQQLSNINPNDQKSNQNKQNMFASSSIVSNRETLNQFSNSIIQQKNCTKLEINDKIWFQEDIFYEKNYKKLGTKVTVALKSQYLEQSLNNSSAKQKQNFEKATHIINKLLNASMNRVMKIRQHVQNFINLLKLRHFNRKMNDLKENEYQIVNDLSYFYQKNEKKVKGYQILMIFNCFLRLTKMFPIFMPTDLLRVLWDMLQVIFTYSFLYIYSLLIFFDQNEFNSDFILRFYYFSFIMFLADIFVNLNTALFNKDNIIIKRKDIFKQYFFSTTFITDFLSLLTLSSKVIYQSQSPTYDQNDNLYKYGFNILIFLKVNGISQKKKRFNYIFTLTENQKHIIKLINQIASVITAAHIAAIGWYFIGIQEKQNNQSNWLAKLDIQDHAYYERYAYSIYWSITTMTTAHEQRDRDKKAEDQILSVLSNKLREEITIEIHSKILNSYFLLSSNFSQTTLSRLIFIMEEVLINPNEVIIREKEFDDSAIYFIQSGTIEIYQQQIKNQNKVNIIKVLRDGQIFGELSFFSGLKRQASARSVNLSTIYKMSRNKFIEILKENIEDFERFKMMQDQIVFQNDLSVIYTECYSCKNIGHISNQCPRIHMIKDQQHFVLRQNYSIFQERAQIERKSKKLKLQDKYQIKKNKEAFVRLKQNLKKQNDQCYLLFETNENLLSSENSQSRYLNDDEDEEESLSQLQLQFDEQNNNFLNISKVFLEKKAENLLKSIIKTNNFYQQSLCENESLANLENQCQSNKSLHNQENVEFKRVASNTQCTYVKTQTFDAIDNINNNSMNQESSLNALSSKNALGTEYNRIIYKNEPEYFNQNIEIQNQQQNQDDEEGIAKQKSSQNTASFLNVLQSDQEKKQLKLGQQSNKIYQYQIEEQNQNQNKDTQKQSSFTDTQNKTFFNQSKSRHILSQKSIKLLNQNLSEHRSSVDQILLSHIIANSLVGDQRVFQQKHSQNRSSFLQDIKENNLNNSEKSVKDYKEKPLNQKSILSQILFYNSNQKEQKQNVSNNKQDIQQNQQKNQNNHQPSEIELMKKLSKIFQQANLPLLLQLANGKSSLKAEPSFLPDLLDLFDKLYQFKKYFPHNNFQKVIQSQKKIQYEQKKQKKNKLASKQRRQNIGFLANNARFSIFNGSANLIKFIPQDYDINLYKPTYLSYGVKMQNGTKFPTFFKFRCNN